VEPEPLERITNSLKMELRLITAGVFQMGSPQTEPERHLCEGPRHKVHITKAFYLGVFPVTQRAYKAVMGKNPAFFTERAGGGPDHPVEHVSWWDAVKFCEKLSILPEEQREGRAYRLPTEAEWEYACRAGESTIFHFDDALTSTQANFDGNFPYGGAGPRSVLQRLGEFLGFGGNRNRGPFLQRTSKVSTYAPNAWGLYDMHGNVWEWCADYFTGEPYSPRPQHDPQGPAQGEARVVRGGSWYVVAADCRAAARLGATPDERHSDLGFRVACVISATSS
jgi:formylglycine-generating enzyme required for sulfatase activity